MRYSEIKSENKECFGEEFCIDIDRLVTSGRVLMLEKEPLVFLNPNTRGDIASFSVDWITVNSKRRPFVKVFLYDSYGNPVDGSVRVEVVYDKEDVVEKLYETLTGMG